MKIAVVGSINIDQSVETDRIPRKGETIAGQSLQYTPGGKGANQAVAMGRLGAEVMEVTGYIPWNLCERLKLRDEVKKMCPHCKIALIVDSNTERQAAIEIRDAKKNGFIDQFFYGSMTAEYLMDQIYAM